MHRFENICIGKNNLFIITNKCAIVLLFSKMTNILYVDLISPLETVNIYILLTFLFGYFVEF